MEGRETGTGGYGMKSRGGMYGEGRNRSELWGREKKKRNKKNKGKRGYQCEGRGGGGHSNIKCRPHLLTRE